MQSSARRLQAVVFAIAFVAAGCSESVAPTASSVLAVQSQPIASPTGQATPTESPVPTPIATPDSAGQARWITAGIVPPRERANRIAVQVVSVGSGNLLMVGADNICTPGEAWAESAYSDVWRSGDSTWEPVGDLPRPRDRFALASLPDGSVLVAGGTTDQPPQSFISSLRFDPATSRWERLGDLTVARSNPSGSALRDGRVLIAGGYFVNEGAGAERMHRSAELFDPESGTWSPTGSLIQPRAGASAVTLADGRVLIVGGLGRSGTYYYELADPLSSAELFDPDTETWSETGSLPAPVASASLVALPNGGALLVERGAAWRFRRERGRWTETGPMATEADGRSLVTLLDGRVLAVGGSIGTGEEERYVRRAEIYDPERDAWSPTTQLPGPRRYADTLLLDDGSVLLAGGATEILFGAPSCPVATGEALRFIP